MCKEAQKSGEDVSEIITGLNEVLQGAVVFHFDITDRKKAEKSLQESEERFRNFVENAHDIVFTVKFLAKQFIEEGYPGDFFIRIVTINFIKMALQSNRTLKNISTTKYNRTYSINLVTISAMLRQHVSPGDSMPIRFINPG